MRFINCYLILEDLIRIFEMKEEGMDILKILYGEDPPKNRLAPLWPLPHSIPSRTSARGIPPSPLPRAGGVPAPRKISAGVSQIMKPNRSPVSMTTTVNPRGYEGISPLRKR
jgi:hypothetical protein